MACVCGHAEDEHNAQSGSCEAPENVMTDSADGCLCGGYEEAGDEEEDDDGGE